MTSLHSSSRTASRFSRRSLSAAPGGVESLDVQALRRGNEANFVRQVMLDVSPESLHAIRNTLMNDTVTLPMFVPLIKHHLSDEFKNSFIHPQLELALAQLFLDIDVNGDGTLESDEFSAYVASSITTAKTDVSELKYFTLPLIRTSGINVSRSTISTIVFVDSPASRIFASIDNSSFIAAWDNYPYTQLKPFGDDLPSALSKPVTLLPAHLSPCTCLCALSRDAYVAWSWLASGSTDRSVVIYDAVTLVERSRVLCSSPVLALSKVVVKGNCRLCVGTQNGDVFLLAIPTLQTVCRFNVLSIPSPFPITSAIKMNEDSRDSEEKRERIAQSRAQSRQGKAAKFAFDSANPVTALCGANVLGLVICGFQDGSVLWFDADSGALRGGHNNSSKKSLEVNTSLEKSSSHSTAVLSIVWSEKAKTAVTVSYNRFALGYNCVNNGSVFRLGGGHFHTSPIISQVLIDDSVVATFDMGNVCCFWRLSTLECLLILPTLSPALCPISFPDFILTSVPGVLCQVQVLGRKPPLLQDTEVHHKTVSVLFSDSLLNFITLSPRAVFTWDSLTGRKVSEWVLEEEGLMMIFDDRERKVVIGLSSGNLIVLNVTNGSKLKTLFPIDDDSGHVIAKDLVFISFSPQTRYVLAAYLNNKICFFNENDIEDSLKCSSFVTLPHEPSCGCCLVEVFDTSSSSIPFFMVGTVNGDVYAFDPLSLCLLNKGLPLFQHPGAVTTAAYVDRGICLTGDVHGNVVLSLVKGHRAVQPISPVLRLSTCNCLFAPLSTNQSTSTFDCIQTQRAITNISPSKDSSLVFISQVSGKCFVLNFSLIFNHLTSNCLIIKRSADDSVMSAKSVSYSLFSSARTLGSRFFPLIELQSYTISTFSVDDSLKLGVNCVLPCSIPPSLVVGTDSFAELLLVNFEGKIVGKTFSEDGGSNSEAIKNDGMTWNFEPDLETFLTIQRSFLTQTLAEIAQQDDVIVDDDEKHVAEAQNSIKNAEKIRNIGQNSKSSGGFSESTRQILAENTKTVDKKRIKELSKPNRFKLSKNYVEYSEIPGVSDLVNKLGNLLNKDM
ncbi:hypothetical protein RCL1_004101 [Eukaryota sp. TZLM3-RCL]